MASAYSYMFFSLFLILFITSQFSYARNPKGQLDLSARFLPRTQAERQIRGLNLFPKHAINRPAFDEDELSGSSSPRIAEKQFQFHLLGSPGPSVQQFGHYAGYYRLSHTKAARMFYYFFESRSNKNDPVVIWLTGGPGCSSELALFYENGPFNIANNLSLSWNDYGWDKASNIIFSAMTCMTSCRHFSKSILSWRKMNFT
ncbi:hypothetical protein OIU84_015280 [Salix udensis]|uniref:Uncharacterized protein n=1 Tax=Salix udensis TaxID=889485 RepID=A0AAD6NSG3_9ROSI|nr:hypothetical protein OIU84_015280 [Salix udensis]